MGSNWEDDKSSDSDHRDKRRKTNHMRQPAPNGAAKANPGASPAAANSFAAKMMAKMGYKEGQGLGATGKGRLAPIETQVRPQGAGLGAVKEKTKQAKAEEKREAAFRGKVFEESSEEERKRKRKLKEKRLSGVTSGAGTPAARAKLKYRTATEMEAAAEGLEVPNVLKSIIDATGQETRLLASTAGLMSSGVAMVPSETESMKIARRARRDLEAFMDEWRALKEREDYFVAEQTQLLLEVQREEEEIHAMADVVATVLDLQQMSLGDSIDGAEAWGWEGIICRLESLEVLSGDDKGHFGLQEVAAAAISPLFKITMEGWEPLRHPNSIVAYLYRLQHILSIRPQSKSTEIALQDGVANSKPQSKSTTPYETMLHKYWLPRVRSAITNNWDVHNPDLAIDLVKTWEPVLPPFILANVVDQLVVRRLTDAVAAWKPKSAHKHRRHTQPQAWLFPWLEYLDEQHTNPRSSTGLLADVKRKLKIVLSTWDLGAGVLPGLDSWGQVFHSDLSSMLVRHLLPRLALYLSEAFSVDPSDQDLTPLEKVLEWRSHLAPNAMVQLIVAEFFTKWHQILFIWLTSEAANFAEISQWYQWWKETLEEKTHDTRRSIGFNELPEIAAEWNKGVESINCAIDAIENGADVTTSLEPPSIHVTTPDVPLTPAAAVLTPKPTTTDTPTTFKDVVEDWCAESDLHMIALREADLQTGLPLFRITASASGKGGAVVYLKGDVVWARGAAIGGIKSLVFMPMGLDDGLIAKAEGR